MDKKVTHKRHDEKEVVTHLLVDGKEMTKKEVYDDLTNNDYYTYPNGKKGAKIIKHGKYHLKTKTTDNENDNLDNLPSIEDIGFFKKIIINPIKYIFKL